MGTFFSSRALKDIVLEQSEFIDAGSQLVPHRGSILANWFEFTASVGFDSGIALQNMRRFVQKKNSTNAKPELPGEMLSAINQIINIINGIYSYIIQSEFEQSENDYSVFGFTEIPVIDHELREFGANHFSQTDIAGTFLVELKEEIPSFVDNLELPARQTFEKGVDLYRRYVEEKANERFQKAQKKTEHAIEIEDKAEQIKRTAFQKTDAALGAEATAEGLERLTSHWREKARFHKKRREINFWIFVGILALALVFLFFGQTGVLRTTFFHLCGNAPYCPTPWQRYFHATALYAGGNGNWLIALLSLKGILIPILGVAWLLRILSRQSQSHFALENDSRQRLALLVSYVRLQEIPEKELTDGERLMILTELFRPIDPPSHVDGPPNLAELIAKFKP
ncbi:hypothetical protein ACFQEX_14150 [Roseibium salinum]|uniref:hypothetical protein n=1 Tax=Roseibium salinum TaxID=1604349 RepID=UPI003623823F